MTVARLTRVGAAWRSPGPSVTPLDSGIVLLLLVGGLLYHWDATHWGIAYIGDSQYGDAEFWWNGAIHFSRGILADNPGQGFRPGYIVLTGLALSVLGTQFLLFHKCLAAVFLAVAAAFYLSLRDVVGRLASFCTVGLLVFNPYHAEWIATSTTDGTGLVLHLLALTCLLRGLAGRRSLRWLAAFGVLFALATLTRPILTPFIAIAIGVSLVSLPGGWKANATAALTGLIAFLVPFVAWIAIQRAIIDEWSVSANEASAFYAASDPAIQVWNNEMYSAVAASARSRLGVATVTSAQLNQEFWRLTVRNYRMHWRYHLSRQRHNVWELAGFGPHLARRGHLFYRSGFLALFLLGSLTALALSRDWPRTLLSALLLVVCLVWPVTTAALFVLAGFVVALVLPLLRRTGAGCREPSLLVIALYWLVGVAGLSVIGGTWSSGGPSPVYVNALGYRVGSQVFFAGDLLAFAFLAVVLKPPPAFTTGWAGSLIAPRGDLSRAAAVAFGACAATVVLILAVGAGVVAVRWWALGRAEKQPYPPLDSMVASAGAGPTVVGPPDPRLALHQGARPAVSPTVVMTGAGSEFLWNLEGQERAQLLVYRQTFVHPFSMHPGGLIVELPAHQEPRDWTYRQGVFILKRIPNRPVGSNLPYFISETAVRGFIPLSPEGSGYDVSRARWFPLAVYASQLEANGMLTVASGAIEWREDSGPTKFKRRLLLKPAPTGDPVISIALARFQGLRSLRLESPAPPPGRAPTSLRIVVHPPGGPSWSRELAAGGLVRVPFREPRAESARLEFSGIPPEGFWLYELNVLADDVESG